MARMKQTTATNIFKPVLADQNLDYNQILLIPKN